MKKYIVILIFLTLISNSIFSQSKPETIEWIYNKFNESNNNNIPTTLSLNDFWDNHNLKFVSHHSYFNIINDKIIFVNYHYVSSSYEENRRANNSRILNSDNNYGVLWPEKNMHTCNKVIKKATLWEDERKCKRKFESYSKTNIIDSIVIPLSKIEDFSNWKFKTYSSQINIYSLKITVWGEIAGCKHRKGWERHNLERSNSTQYSYEIPQAFRKSIIENYEERIHKAFNHLMELSKEGDGMFDD